MLLENCSSALKPGGRLILARVDEEKRHKLIRKLLDHGFASSPTVLPFSLESDAGPAMVVAKKLSDPRLAVEKLVIALPDEVSPDLEAFIAALQQRLNDDDLDVETALWSDLPTTMEGKAVISLVEAEKPVIFDLNNERFAKIKSFFTNGSKGGVWLTRGNAYLDGGGDPAYDASTGLIRVMRNEKQESKFTQLALSHQLPLARQLAVDLVVTSFRDVFEADSLDKVAETELGELDGLPYIPRLYDEPLHNRRLDLLGKLRPAEPTRLLEQGRHRRLEIGDLTDLKSLRFVDIDQHDLTIEHDDDVIIDLQAHGVSPM